MRTKADLANRTAFKMGLIDANVSLSGADSNYIQSTYDSKLAEWSDRNLVYWANTGSTVNEIPESIFEALAALLGNWVGPEFGFAMPLDEKLKREELLLVPLRRHINRRSTGLPNRADYY